MISLAPSRRATLLRRALPRPPHLKTYPGPRAHSTNTSSKAAAETGAQGNGATQQTQKASMSTTSTAQTIPMAASYWLAPFKVPVRHYIAMNQRRPYVTQLLSTLTIWLVGDILSQYIVWSPEDREDKVGEKGKTPGAAPTFSEAYDPKRTFRSLIIGGIASIPSYRWFVWLGTAFNYPSLLLSLSAKVVFNQLTFTPVFNCYFFGMQMTLSKLMDGELPSGREVWERLMYTVPKSWVNSCKVWPAVTAFSFWAVPVDLRSPFAGVIAIGWQTYLSVLNQRAARQQALEATVEIKA